MGETAGTAWKVVTLAALVLAGLAVYNDRPRDAAQPKVGEYINPSPVPSPQDAQRRPGKLPSAQPTAAFAGARVSNSLTQESRGPARGLSFDTADVDSCGCYEPDQPTRLTFPWAGMWQVDAHVTALGTGYGHRTTENVVLEVKRDGDATGFTGFDHVSSGSGYAAEALNAGSADWYEAGEYVEVFVTPARTAVESNWPGRGNMSPVLTVTYLGRGPR